MIDKNRTYRTRDGREVRIYATDGGDYPVHGAIKYKKKWTATCWDKDGKWGYVGESPMDLIEVRPRHKRTVWLNVYDCHTLLYESRKDSDSMSADGRIACIKVELDFEEGEGL